MGPKSGEFVETDEIALALSVQPPQRDKVCLGLWSQPKSYVHKSKTGRKDRFGYHPQHRWVEGGLGPSLEARHDCYWRRRTPAPRLSAALGMCRPAGISAGRERRTLSGEFGDAALNNGISFDALNNVPADKTLQLEFSMIMSGALAKRNVRAISAYLKQSNADSLIRHNQYTGKRILRKILGGACYKGETWPSVGAQG